MRVLTSLICISICFAAFSTKAAATIILTFNPNNSFQADSGIQSVTVFANSDQVGGEVGPSIGARFRLSVPAGAPAGTPIPRFNAPNAGTFGGAGFLGNGNILAAASSFNRGTANNFDGFLNIIFTDNAQRVSTATPLANLLIDTTGLNAGTYQITTGTTGFFGLADIPVANGSFTITAVPEPTTTALLCVAAAGFVVRRVIRRRKAKFATVD